MAITKKTFNILFFIVFFSAIAFSSYPYTNDFSVSVSQNNNICGGSFYEGKIFIKNNLAVPQFITIAPYGEYARWSVLDEYSFFLSPLKSKEITEIIKPKSTAYGSHIIHYTIKSNTGFKSDIEHKINVKRCNNIYVLSKLTNQTSCPCTPMAFSFNITNIADFSDMFSFSVSSENKSLPLFYTITNNNILLDPSQSTVVDVYIKTPCSVYGKQKVYFTIKSSTANSALRVPLYLNLNRDCYNYSLSGYFKDYYLDLQQFNISTMDKTAFNKIRFRLLSTNMANISYNNTSNNNNSNTSTIFYFDLVKKQNSTYNACFNNTYLIPFKIINTAEIYNSYKIAALHDPSLKSFFPENIALLPKEEKVIPLVVFADKPGNYSIVLKSRSSRGDIIKNITLNFNAYDCTGSYNENQGFFSNFKGMFYYFLIPLIIILLLILLFFIFFFIMGRHKEGTEYKEKEKKEKPSAKTQTQKKAKKEKPAKKEQQYTAYIFPIILIVLFIILFVLLYYLIPYLSQYVRPYFIPSNYTNQTNVSNATYDYTYNNSQNLMNNSNNQSINFSANAANATNKTQQANNTSFLYRFTAAAKGVIYSSYTHIKHLFLSAAHFLCKNMAVIFLVVLISIFMLIICSFICPKSKLFGLLPQRNFFIILLIALLILFFVFFYFSIITKSCVFSAYANASISITSNKTLIPEIYSYDYNSQLKENKTLFIIYKDTPKEIDLNDIVYDPDNDFINISVTRAKNITSVIKGTKLIITPDPGFYGTRVINLIARDQYGATAYSPNIKLVVVKYKKPGIFSRIALFITAYIYYIIIFLTFISVVLIFLIIRPKKEKKPTIIYKNKKPQKSKKNLRPKASKKTQSPKK